MRPRVRRWLAVGVDLVFPPACAHCRVALEGATDVLLCEACRDDFVDARKSCSGCAALAPPVGSATSCPGCKHERFRFSRAARLGVYDGALRTAVLRIKRERNPGLAMALGDLLAATHRGELGSWRPDAVVAIPMHWSRQMWRGVNSAETIAGRLAARLDVPLASHLLVRRRRTAPQARLARSRRKANVRGAFRARSSRDLRQARLLLVDDIMTTGATLSEAAGTLVKAGADSIHVAVLARAAALA